MWGRIKEILERILNSRNKEEEKEEDETIPTEETLEFILPDEGGAMVHSDPYLTDNIALEPPIDNIDEIWFNPIFKGEKVGTLGNGIAGNGRIAANTFNGSRDNLVIYDYNGEAIYHSEDLLNPFATSSSPMVDINNRVIACDNKKIIMVGPKDNNYEVLWETPLPKRDSKIKKRGIFTPFSPNIVNKKTIILPTSSGPVYAFNVHDGILIDKIYLGYKKINDNEIEYYSTINSACVNGNRFYVTTKSNLKKNNEEDSGRLYAIDVFPDARNPGDRLKEAWNISFKGSSQASPMFNDDKIYFDSYYTEKSKKKHFIHAVKDMGSHGLDDFIEYPHRTMYSFSKDPRGGFWFEDDCCNKLVHFNDDLTRYENDDNYEINIKKLVGHDIAKKYKPMSCMTICGNEKRPIMIISAINVLHEMYVMAVDLNDDNSRLWKYEIKSKLGQNYAGGQFTILNKSNDDVEQDPLLVFGTYYDGVMAIGKKNNDEGEPVEDIDTVHPDHLEKGDILLMRNKKSKAFGWHCAMYVGDDLFIESRPGSGVRLANFKQASFSFNELYYGYVKDLYRESYDSNKREEIINKAISWAKKQIGKKYQFLQYQKSTANWDPNDKSDRKSDRWYCSELVWAAYMNSTNGKLNLGNKQKKKDTKYEEIWVKDLMKDEENIQQFTPKKEGGTNK